MRRPLYLALTVLSVALIFACQREVSFEAAQASKGSLLSASGDCMPMRVAGVYKVGQVLNDSNYLEVSVNVTQTGTWNIHTDTLNGYSFRGNGTFAAIGLNTVRLKGSGKPVTAQDDDFTVRYDSSNCFVTVTVLGSGSSSGGSAIFTLQGSGGTCMNYALGSGTYTAGTALNSTNKVDIQVNVTTVGSWTLSTNTVDGFSFSGNGTFTTAGVQTVTLLGSGTPTTAGAQTFSVTAGSASCTFPVTVGGGTTPPVTCATAQGTYTVGTPLTTSNKITASHTYATAGSYVVSTNTVNGFSFGPSTVTVTAATAGTPVAISLNGSGTPVATGTHSFTVDYGDGTTCSFTVVTTSGTTPPPTNTDYFPLTAGSWWSYDDGVDHNDSFKTTNAFVSTLNSTTYRAFESADDFGPFDTSYYRKDASTGYYYNFVPNSSIDPSFPITFPGQGIDIQFMRNSLTTNATWNSDHNGTASGAPITLRFAFTCLDANATLTINGNTFTNVYKINEQLQVGGGSSFSDAGTPVIFYYAKGIGLIRVDDSGDLQDIKHWVVN